LELTGTFSLKNCFNRCYNRDFLMTLNQKLSFWVLVQVMLDSIYISRATTLLPILTSVKLL